MLDNPSWFALRGPHGTFGRIAPDGLSAKYRRSVFLAAAIDDSDDVDAWRSLADLIGPGGLAMLFRDEVERVPKPLIEVFRRDAIQYVLGDGVDLGDLSAPDGLRIADLDASDYPAVASLISATKPGPFESETMALGDYIGVFEGDRLVAMAGRRVRTPHHGEVSAVCTLPEMRGLGLGSLATRLVSARIRAAGEVPFLHVVTDNTGAAGIYTKLGFTIRRPMQVVGVTLG